MVKIEAELVKIVGFENVPEDLEVLVSYSRDCSLSNPRMPHYMTADAVCH